MKKPSFLERLVGAVPAEEYDRVLSAEHRFGESDDGLKEDDRSDGQSWEESSLSDNAVKEGELPVDMYQTGDAIIIRAFIAGVSPGDLDISITRDMVTIKGIREEFQETPEDDYQNRELFWGKFSRTLLLPEEIVIDESEAQEKHGLLEIRLPKLDKRRSTRLRVKSGAQHKA
jgi:HSP20 family protein